MEENKVSAGKKTSYVQVTLVIIVIVGLLVGLVPWLVGTYFDKFVKLRTIHRAAMFAKVSGTVSDEKIGKREVVVITATGGAKYVLVGSNLKDVIKFKGKHLEVFGKMMAARPAVLPVNGKPVKVSFNIDVSKMAASDLTVGTPITPEQAASMKARADEQNAYQEATLAKLHKKGMDVIKGKVVFERYRDTRTRDKQGMVMLLIDSYNTKHILIGAPIIPIAKNYRTYENSTLVFLGHDYDDPIPGVPFEPGVRTFRVRLAYFDNLTQIKDLAQEKK